MQRAYRLFPAPEDAFETLLRRRDRRRTRRRVVSVLVPLALIAATAGAALRLLADAERRVPADPSETPSVYQLDVLPELPADLHVLPDLRSQVVVASGSFAGVPWTLRTNEDASCTAFVREDGNTRAAGYGEEHWGLVGPGGATESCELDTLGDLVVVGTGKTDGPLGFLLFGTVSLQVEAIEVSIDGFGPIEATVLPALGEVGGEVRYFVAASGPGVTRGLVGSVTAIGADEQVLATYRFPSDADRPGGVSAPMQTLWWVRWSGEWGIGIWRNALGDWCFGEVGGGEGYGWLPPRGPGCTTREHLFDGIRQGDIAIADAVVLSGHRYTYQAWGTTSEAVAAVRVEFSSGRVISVSLHAADGFPSMGMVFAFARRQDPADGFGGRVIALDANGRTLDEVPLPTLTPVEDTVSTWSP
jgi:hypothetical protein